MNPQNVILSRLPSEVYRRIEPDLERVSLPRGKVVHTPGEVIQDLYFPVTCMISVTLRMSDGKTVLWSHRQS